ncbi:hypothetical protein [Bradyrhizobium oligotrophicum]|uniref:hypothetical protein n=1 Tax=Bradyrhizobium oligotrophicum TaxID=44255 RepID=UPI003EBD4542
MDQTRLLSRTNFDEYNQIFWDLHSIKSEMGQQWSPDTIELRMSDLEQWVCRGNTLIVIGMQWIRLEDDFSPNDFEPLRGSSPQAKIDLEIAEGYRIEAYGPAAAREQLEFLAEHMAYSCCLASIELKPLLRVRRANNVAPIQIVGAIRQLGSGHVIYLPRPKGTLTMDWAAPLAAIRKLAVILTRGEADELPEWVHDFRSQTEQDAMASIDVLNAEAARIEQATARHRVVLGEALRLKQLIAGSGQPFADVAAAALAELGLRVVKGQHPRADLVVSDGRRIAAVELKGVDGCIAEKHLRQLWAWMTEIDHILSMAPKERSREQADYVAAITQLETPVGEVDTKGFLIVGTYRTTPISRRVERDLPDALERRVGIHDVCILTGLQLLGLILSSRRDPALKPIILQELFDTRGRLNRALDWKEYLSPR